MTGETLSFGPYRLKVTERLLTRDDKPVEIGGRALDVLIALTNRAGQVVSNRELMNFVWPHILVEEANLRMHIAALRRVLEDGKDGVRYIINVPGRGYSFVAPTQRSGNEDGLVRSTRAGGSSILPPFPSLLIGRSDAIHTLSSLLLSRRFVSLIGPGGIGKTTVAIAMAHGLHQVFGEDAVFFVDLGSISDPACVAGAVASAIGCIGLGVDPERSILAFLSYRRSLIVIDSCEHVIKTAAPLSERLFAEAPSLHLLTTSREAFRVKGENVHFLTPLDSPKEDRPSAFQALRSPAVQLFMERAAASGYEAELNDADAPVVAAICRILDGMALAIELAASRVGAYGIQGTADLLKDGARMLLHGRRSALPRHQTLQAMFDWSFELLSGYDQKLFSRLSVFVGQFTLEAAQCIIWETDGDAERVGKALLSLADKSLVATSSVGGRAYFRLLDMARAYAAERLLERGEEQAIATRHARYFANLLEAARSGSETGDRMAAAYAPHMGNIRKALGWSLSRSGDAAVAVELAGLAAPLFLQLSLFSECQDYCQNALVVMREADRGTQRELELREALAISSMWTQGISEEVRIAIKRGLELSKALRDWRRHIRFLSGLNIFLVRLGDFGGSLAAAKRSLAVADATGSPDDKVIAEWMLGASYHFAGNQRAALFHCERGFQLELNAAPSQVDIFGFNHRVRALVALARSLWLRGSPDQARKVAYQTVHEASEHERPISECIALLYVIPVFLWCGDFDHAAPPIDVAIAKAGKHSLAPYHALGFALKGELMVATGDVSAGVEILRQALKTLRAYHHHIVTPSVTCTLAEGLTRCGQVEEARVTIEEVTARVEEVRGTFWMPDLLRVRGEILLSYPKPDLAAAEHAFLSSIEAARKQSALSWELRAAIPLARMWSQQGRIGAAQSLLEEVYARFTEGFATQDLIKARQILVQLGGAACPMDE